MLHVSCVLLTGGTGFVGRRLAPSLAARFPGHRRVILGRPEHSALKVSPAECVSPGWETILLDMTDEAALDSAVEALKPSVVIHLAAQSSVGDVARFAETTWRVNFCGTFALARAVARVSPRCLFFFSSSGEVYGSSFLAGPAIEQTAAAPLNGYSLSKLAAERILQDLLPAECRLVIARAFNHTGPGQDDRFVLPSFAGQIARAELGKTTPVIHVGNLDASRDFLHVDDVISAYMSLIGLGEDLPPRTLVNVASGQPSKLRDVLDMMLKRSTRPLTVKTDPRRLRPSDIPSAVGNASAIQALTGWHPTKNMTDIITDLLDWSRATERSASI